MSDLTITSLGEDVDDLMAMSAEELRTLVTEKCGEMSDEELTTLIETINTDFAAVQDGINDDEDDAEDKLDAAEDADDASDTERYTDELEELQELEAGLDAIQESINAEVERQVYLNRESSDDVSVFVDGAFTADDLADGETISITATGADAEGIFEEDETVSNDPDGDGIASDINGDGRIDAADLYYEADTGAEYDFSAHQEIYFSLTSTQQITATAYDASRQARTFTVYDSATLKTFNVEIIGNVRIQFQGTNYITDSALNSASDDITRYSYDNDDDQPWYDNLHVDNSTPTVDEQMSAIPGYQDIVDNLPTDLALMATYIAQSAALSDSSTDVALPSNAPEIITTLVGYLLDSANFNSYNSETDLTEAWDKVYAELATYGQDLQAVLLGSLTYVMAKTSLKNSLTVATNANATLFQTLFASQVIKIETIVGYAGDGNANEDGKENTDMGAFGKFIYTVMGLDSGGTGYTANTAMLTDGLSYSKEEGVAGNWSNYNENALSLDWYGLFKSAVGQSPPAEFAATKAREDALAEAAAEAEASGLLYEVTFTKDDYNAFLGKIDTGYVEGEWFDGINGKEYEAGLTSIADAMYEATVDGPITIEAMAQIVMDAVALLSEAHNGDVVDGFIRYLDNVGGGELLKSLCATSGFISTMRAYITNEATTWETGVHSEAGDMFFDKDWETAQEVLNKYR